MDADAPAQLRRRSCFKCQRKKVRCDRKDRCSLCVKHNARCAYPVVFSAQSKRQTCSRTGVNSRLDKLEDILLRRSGPQASCTAPQPTVPGSFTTSKTIVEPGSPASALQKKSQRHRSPAQDGKSLEASNGAWDGNRHKFSTFSDNIPSQKAQLSPGSTKSSCIRLFFHTQSLPDLEPLELSLAQKSELWIVFKQNVDPLVKVLHRPTTQTLFNANDEGPCSSFPETEALLNAIYFAAVVSLDADMTRMRLGRNKETLMAHLRSSLESALTRASFLTTASIEAHQAFAIYLFCLRSQHDSHIVSKLTRIALGLARSHGFHRDGSNLGLSPFETEIRRRLWWMLLCLDTRCSEDNENGPDFALYLEDTQIPLNINDDDLTPQMMTWPKPRSGCTDMTLSLIRIELVSTWRQLRLSACVQRYTTPEPQSLHHQYELINNCQKIINQKYLSGPGFTSSSKSQQGTCTSGDSYVIHHLSTMILQLVLAKMWVTVHSAPTSQPRDQVLHSADQEQLLNVSTRILELSTLLYEDEPTAHWSWLFRTYVQWQAMTFVLTELCRRQPDDSTRRAWRAVDAIHDGKTLQTAESQGHTLADSTRKLREEALARRIRQSRNSAA